MTFVNSEVIQPVVRVAKVVGTKVADFADKVATGTGFASIFLLGGCAFATAATMGVAVTVCGAAVFMTNVSIGAHLTAAGGAALAGDFRRAGHSLVNAGVTYLSRNSNTARAIFGFGMGFAFYQLGVHLPLAVWKYARNNRAK